MTSTRYRVRVRYTEPMVRQAVRTFVWRRFLARRWLLLGAVVLMIASIAFGWREDGPTVLTGIEITILGFFVLIYLLVWRSHFNNTVGRFRALDPPEADMMFDETDMTVASNLGSGTLPWTTFIEVWELPTFWMLFSASNVFITLPVATLDPATLAFLRGRLSKAIALGKGDLARGR